METKKFEIIETTANGVLQYLATRPYQEVYTLINELQQITPIKEEEETKEEA